MDCKQCGAGNDERAIECAFCGGVLRRAYPYDPMGEWLTGLEDKFDGIRTPRSTAASVAWTVIGIGLPVGVAVALRQAELIVGWFGIVATIVGVLAVMLGALEFLPQGRGLTRVEQQRSAVFTELEQYRRGAEIERWRLAVMMTEALPRGSLLHQGVLAEDQPRE